MWEMPPFDEGLATFLRVIRDQGVSTDLLWVFRKDITTCRHDVWIRLPVSTDNIKRAQRDYEEGRRRGYGVGLEVLCLIRGRSACTVRLSGYRTAGKPLYGAMKGPLYVSVPTTPVEARPVRSTWTWAVRRWVNRCRRCDSLRTTLSSCEAEIV